MNCNWMNDRHLVSGCRRPRLVGRSLVAVLVSASMAVAALGCGPPRYRYHFSTKGGAERFPIVSQPPPPQADAGTDGPTSVAR
jgi:hypothetical protein